MFTISYLTQEAAGGLAAGIFGTVIGYPLDLIKTRMQTGRGISGGGIISTGLHIVRSEGGGGGILALYKGVGPPLLSLSILNTINFASYSYFHSALQASRGWDIRNACAGAAIGPIASTVSTVENLIKTQMQLDISNQGRNSQNQPQQRQYQNSLDCWRKLTRKHGIMVVYTGHVINTARESTFLATYFYVYEGFRKGLVDGEWHLFGDNSRQKEGWLVPVAGGFSGAIAWTVSFPLDCVRARIQGRNLSDQSFQSGAVVVAKLLAEQGILGLYAGVGPSIVRAFLVSGSRFSAYEAVLWFLRGGRES